MSRFIPCISLDENSRIFLGNDSFHLVDFVSATAKDFHITSRKDVECPIKAIPIEGYVFLIYSSK